MTESVALNYASHIHYNDHLAPIAILMEIPLLVLEQIDYDVCKKYYPGIDVRLVDYETFTPEALSQKYSHFFVSDLWDRHSFKEKFGPFEKKYSKTIRNIHVPHGYSDKGFYIKKAALEDITLVYGQNMLDMFLQENVLHHLQQYILTGNYRYTFFKKHEEFYDNIVKKEILTHFDQERKIILYAPTWMDLFESTTYFDSIDQILENIPDEYNIIIKPHPRLELDNIEDYYKILGKYQNNPRIFFLTEFPLIFPLLKYTDIYLGDMSSIGYDFLIFNRPMFFLNKDNRDPKKDRSSFLFNCGVPIKKSHFSKTFSIIEKHLENDREKFQKIRQDVWEYTFGKQERDFDLIKQEIYHAIDTPPEENHYQ